MSCDFVVNAIPFLANRDIQVSPPFSPEKQTAIRDTSYGQSGKIMLEVYDVLVDVMVIRVRFRVKRSI